MAFIDLEKAFDHVLWKVIWWALRKLDVESGLCDWGAGDVCQCAEPCPCWWGVQWRVWSEVWCSPRLGTCTRTQPTALHHCSWNLVMRVPVWGPLGGPICLWPCNYRWITQGMCQEALDLERSNGVERAERKCRKDEDHDLWYWPGPPAEFRQVSMRCLLHWHGQQQHLLQWLQALCTRNAVGSSAWQGTLITDVHGARDLHAPWMADHREKSRLDLTSWIW